MKTFLTRNSTSIVVLLSLLVGFLFPTVGLIWGNYLGVLLILLMFFSFLRINTQETKQSLRNLRPIGFALLMVCFFLPLFALPAKIIFPPVIFAGIVLAFASPSAVVTAFWTRIFKGDIAFALVITVMVTLLAVVTIPVTMLLETGTTVGMDLGALVRLLAELVLIPVLAVFLLKRAVSIRWEGITKNMHAVELLIVFLLVWGSIAPGTGTVENDPVQFLSLSIFILFFIALGFSMAYLLGKKFGYGRAIATGIATCVKNAGLSLVIGLSVFKSAVLPPLIANLVVQNLLIVSLELLFRE